MKNVIALLLIFISLLALPVASSAQTPISSQNVSVSAKIGEFYLSVSGIISPFASLSLSSNGNVYKATSADSQGHFSFSKILVNRGFSSFCIDAVDVARLGESYTCFSFEPANDNITMRDVFLPPTLGLNHYEITEGSDVLVYGFGMPGATVTVYGGGGEPLVVTADSNGRYEYKIRQVKQGSYQLIAGAQYQGKTSLLPSRKILLKAFALAEIANSVVKNTVDWLKEAAPLLWLLLLIMSVPVYIWRDKILVFFHLKKKTLHHAWMVGY